MTTAYIAFLFLYVAVLAAAAVAFCAWCTKWLNRLDAWMYPEECED